MVAFKGFTKNLTARLGRGEYQFEIGKKVTEESSKTVRSGFHCCENPFECLSYYHFDNGDRFFQVEAAGSIDEDAYERIACTELTLVKELSITEFALQGMVYMVNHPGREKWEQHYRECIVQGNKAESIKKDYIAIARGIRPIVRGVEGSILGLLVESDNQIVDAKLFVCTKEQEGKWYTLGKERRLEVCNEKEKS